MASFKHEKIQKLEERILVNGEKLSHIDLSNCQLKEFPLDLLLPIKDSIEMINLGGNQLTSLPNEITQFTKLRILFFANNHFTSIPIPLGSMPSLYMLSFKANKLTQIHPQSLSPSIHWLILTDNHIESLPPTIGQLSFLRKFLFAGNKITSLPTEMENCKELELIRFPVNKLSVLPDWLLELPKLSWAAYSSNFFTVQEPATCTSEKEVEISWNDLEVGRKLGEGASGDIFHGIWKKADGSTTPVAVKLFKVLVNSDGSAEDEIMVTQKIGNHPNFVGVYGRLVHHPQDKIGLVLPLLNTEDYFVLGKPPSFDSITRDTYDPSTTFTLSFILNVALNTAKACEHLHSLDIVHGDIYAHNILTKPDGSAILTDFGAASYLPDKFNAVEREKIKKIEIRSYGCLLDDLLVRIDHTSIGHEEVRFSELQKLRDDCMSTDIAHRPPFAEIRQRLENIRSK